MEEYIRGIADAGVKVILSGGAFGEMAMHFIEKVCAGFVSLAVARNDIEWSERQGSHCVLACEVVLCGQESRRLLISNWNGDGASCLSWPLTTVPYHAHVLLPALQYNIMAIRVPSKFELMRLCKSTNTTARSTLGTPTPDEIGFAKSISVQEIGGSNCVVLSQDSSVGKISTVVLRGSTEGFLDDVERAVNDAVNCYKALGRDSRAVPAAGAAEIEIARRIAEYGLKQTGLDQYAIVKYAEAFEVRCWDTEDRGQLGDTGQGVGSRVLPWQQVSVSC